MKLHTAEKSSPTESCDTPASAGSDSRMDKTGLGQDKTGSGQADPVSAVKDTDDQPPQSPTLAEPNLGAAMLVRKVLFDKLPPTDGGEKTSPTKDNPAPKDNVTKSTQSGAGDSKPGRPPLPDGYHGKGGVSPVKPDSTSTLSPRSLRREKARAPSPPTSSTTPVPAPRKRKTVMGSPSYVSASGSDSVRHSVAVGASLQTGPSDVAPAKPPRPPLPKDSTPQHSSSKDSTKDASPTYTLYPKLDMASLDEVKDSGNADTEPPSSESRETSTPIKATTPDSGSDAKRVPPTPPVKPPREGEAHAQSGQGRQGRVLKTMKTLDCMPPSRCLVFLSDWFSMVCICCTFPRFAGRWSHYSMLSLQNLPPFLPFFLLQFRFA